MIVKSYNAHASIGSILKEKGKLIVVEVTFHLGERTILFKEFRL